VDTQGTNDILVIKLGALGDFIQALGPMMAIRRHHRDRRITLLTAAPFADLARAVGCADRIWIDERPRLLAPSGWIELRRRLRAGGFGRAYDLQTSDRSGWYYRLFWPGPYPEWSGIVGNSPWRHANPHRDALHTVKRQREQLALVGITEVPLTDLSGLARQLGPMAEAPAAPYAVVAPGGAAHRPDKRWPIERFAELARRIADNGLTPVVIGGADEALLAKQIIASCTAARDLTGSTSLIDLVALYGKAALAVGNDTGPMHVAAAVGCPAVVLFARASNPDLCAPRGRAVRVLRRDDLADLGVDEVQAAVAASAIGSRTMIVPH